MKVSILIATLALATVSAGTSATELYHPSNAEEGVRFQPDHMSGKTSRIQIYQSVMGAQADGSLHWIGREYPPNYTLVQAPRLGKSRQQVLEELRQWQQRSVSADGKRDLGGEIGWTEAR